MPAWERGRERERVGCKVARCLAGKVLERWLAGTVQRRVGGWKERGCEGRGTHVLLIGTINNPHS